MGQTILMIGTLFAFLLTAFSPSVGLALSNDFNGGKVVDWRTKKW